MCMLIVDWNKIPEFMKTDEVLKYYTILKKKRASLLLKRTFDIIVSSVLLLLLSPLMLIIAIMIKSDSHGEIFFRQKRITQYGEEFGIFKFRTMVHNAEKMGQLTYGNDSRITRSGRIIRKFRLDEIPQLINVFLGQMTFVGTRPEVKKYTDKYTDEMNATLLLPAGVTSMASIYFKDEGEILNKFEDVDIGYIQDILPKKMEYNLEYIKEFSLWGDIKIMLKTVRAVIS